MTKPPLSSKSLLGIGTRTVEEDWAFARAWLRKRLSRDGVVPG